MEEKIKALSEFRYQKALKCFEIAKKLYEEKQLDYAQNRAYYALFDAIRSVVILDDFDSSKHSGIISYFNKYYVKTGIFKPNTSQTIRLASMLREKSDYEDFYEADEEDTKIVIEETESFLKDIETFLKEKRIL